MKKQTALNLKNKKELGQSILEIVFSIAIIALVVTGSIVLIINSVGLKNDSFRRKRASEMAELITEDLINQKQSNSASFWSLTNRSGETLDNFNDFIYSVEYSSDGLNCNNCTNVTITVNWGDDGELEVSRFFSREVN